MLNGIDHWGPENSDDKCVYLHTMVVAIMANASNRYLGGTHH